MKQILNMSRLAGVAIPGDATFRRKVANYIARARSFQAYDLRHQSWFQSELTIVLTAKGATHPDFSCLFCVSEVEFGDAHGLHCPARKQDFLRDMTEQKWIPAQTQAEAAKVALLRAEPLERIRIGLAATRQGFGTNIGLRSSLSRAKQQAQQRERCLSNGEWELPSHASSNRTMATDWTVQPPGTSRAQSNRVRVETADALGNEQWWDMHDAEAQLPWFSRSKAKSSWQSQRFHLSRRAMTAQWSQIS